MEVFKFVSTSGSPFQGGAVVNGATSIRWTERFREASEFEIDAPLSSGLAQFLPLGTFLSHVDTKEVMIVEDHQINEEKDQDPVLKITGRALQCFFENRIVGSSLGYNDPAPPGLEYNLAANTSLGAQVKKLIEDHVILANLADGGEELPYLAIFDAVPAAAVAARVVKRQTLLEAVQDLLETGDLGLKTERQDSGIVNMTVHAGIDKSSGVTFEWVVGELDEAEYLFTSRKAKNVAYVKGRYVEEFVYTGPSKWNRKVLLVDGSDLDDYLDTTPTGAAATTIRQKMAARGTEALEQHHNELNMAQVTISPETQFRFRRDYNIGDIVAVAGNYGAVTLRRVTEYTEVEDENGESGQPILSAIH